LDDVGGIDDADNDGELVVVDVVVLVVVVAPVAPLSAKSFVSVCARISHTHKHTHTHTLSLSVSDTYEGFAHRW
jgi:hypothetical protein